MRSGNKPWTKQFEWLTNMTTVIGKGVNKVAWGKDWKSFFDICQELQEDPESTFKMKRPAKFSETKFADHSHEVYDKLRNNFKPFVMLLEKDKEEGVRGSSDQKKKALEADEIQGKIMNWMFDFSLSGTTDVYKVYRKISCILQRVNILPHDKYDCFNTYLNEFCAMLETVSFRNCPCLPEDWDEEKIVNGTTGEKMVDCGGTLGVKEGGGTEACKEGGGTARVEDGGGKDIRDEVEGQEKGEKTEGKGTDKPICLWPRLHEDVRNALVHGTYRDINMGMMRQEEWRT